VSAYWFEGHAGDLLPVTDISPTDHSDRRKRILCRRCRAFITDAAQYAQFQGRHLHRCVNPAGVTYQFGCYYAAEGCVASGTPTGEHSWFSGYLWQVASCRKCGEHIGWAFSGPGRFFGLITDRVMEE
jgi:hypothetical protein